MNLDKFNDKQKEAIITTQGPVLILAGAGSGKTTVVVNRIANILEQGLANPYEILAITFTNKAANEMKQRVADLIGTDAESMWIHTFHAACMKILRRNIESLGYGRDFLIYDYSDQTTLVKKCMKELNVDDKRFPPRSILSEISKAKDNLQTPPIFKNVYADDYRMSVIAEVYTLYQKRLVDANALDFDDIIMLTLTIFSSEPDVLKYYQNRFKYIFVDEYQDTNNAQYMFTSMLAGGYKNICVVGDDDQSIYKFRGANINNILDFEKEFDNTKVIKLEQNYRSTQNILNAANAVIKHNFGRKSKSLWTENNGGEKIDLFSAHNEYEEADYIAGRINGFVRENGLKYSDCAILYRTNAQSRILETTLNGQSIPYRVLAGLRFYDRKEIKDVIAYLRLVHNSKDNLSLIRVVNEPSRKIGSVTLEKIAACADERGISMFEAMEISCQIDELLKISDKLIKFTNMINDIKKEENIQKPSKLMEMIINSSGYLAMLQAEDTIENQTRIDNINELISSAVEYEKNDEEASLAGYLEMTTLVSDIDNYDENQDCVVMMTMHSAKGLEFPVVFLCGLEDGLFPSSRSMFDEEEIEEERRLCYVGITRAKKHLILSYAQRRTVYGSSQFCKISRFAEEIPEEYLNDLTQRETENIETEVNYKKPFDSKKMISDIINKKTFDVRANPVNINFKPGDAVSHRKFGRGMVVAVTPEGSDVRIEIAFDDVGTKSLMGSFAKLQKES